MDVKFCGPDQEKETAADDNALILKVLVSQTITLLTEIVGEGMIETLILVVAEQPFAAVIEASYTPVLLIPATAMLGF
jgi:hypothetical protein